MQTHTSTEPSTTSPQLDESVFRAAMRRVAGAVCVIASGTPGQRAGLTATAVCSITASPPRLLVCINRRSSAHDPIQAAGALSINVLAADDVQQAKSFAGLTPDLRGEQRFETGHWHELAGSPVLATACAAFACRVIEVIPASTHSMFICEVVAAQSASAPREGLLYVDGHFRHLAPMNGLEIPPMEWLW